jgi:hypothetical protein
VTPEQFEAAVTLDPNDGRYRVSFEYSGAPHRQWVTRFCEKWIATSDTEAEARNAASDHYREWMTFCLS